MWGRLTQDFKPMGLPTLLAGTRVEYEICGQINGAWYCSIELRELDLLRENRRLSWVPLFLIEDLKP